MDAHTSPKASPFDDMVQFMRETQHEKIKRGLRTGLALLAFNRREGVEHCVDRLIDDKVEAALRQAAVSMLGMAYVGGGVDPPSLPS